MSSILLEAANSGNADLLSLTLSNARGEVSVEDINQALLAAARNGHNDCVIILLDANAFPDIVDDDGNTPLLLAVIRYHVDVVQQLIKAGASVDIINTKKQTALCRAACDNHIDLVRILLDAHSNPDITNAEGNSPLMFAAVHSNYEMAELLLQREANVNQQSKRGETALHWCCEIEGNIKLAKLLLQNGARVDVQNCRVYSSLELACELDDLPLVKLLLEHTDNPKLSRWAMSEGLECATRYGLTDILKFLLEAGTDPNTRPDGNQYVIDAANNGHYETIRLLVRYGGKSDKVKSFYVDDTTSESLPIYKAVWNGDVKLANLLYSTSVLPQQEIKKFLTCDELENRIKSNENINIWMKDTFSNPPSLFHISKQNLRAIILSQLTRGTSRVSHDTTHVNRYHKIVSELPLPEILKMYLAMPDL